MSTENPRKILVFCLPGIGDTVLFTPALTRLRRAFPEAHITVLTMFHGTENIVVTNPDADEVRHFDFFHARNLTGLRYVWRLRRERFDVSLLAFPSNRLEYNLLSFLVGSRWRAAHRYQHQTWRNLWFLNNIVVREAGDRHNAVENLQLVSAICTRLGVPVPADAAPPLRVELTAEDREYGERFLADQGIVPGTLLFGVHAFSSTYKNMHRKCWDKERFVELITQLSAQHPAARFLLFSGPHDEAVNQAIQAQTAGQAILVRETNLRRALGIMGHCRVFISNDSALMHLASAMAVPVVALFGPTDWRRLEPWGGRHVIVREDLPCMPCFYYSSRALRCRAGIDYACMRELPVERVLAGVAALLAVAPPTVCAPAPRR